MHGEKMNLTYVFSEKCVDTYFSHILANEIAAICMELSNRSHSKNIKITEAATVCSCVQSQSLGLAVT